MGNVNTRGYSYNYYQFALLLPLAVSFIFAFIMIFCLTIRRVYTIFHSGWTGDLDGKKLPWKTALYGLPQLVFQLYEEEEDEDGGKKKIFLGGRQILPIKLQGKKLKKPELHSTLAVVEVLFVNSIIIIILSALIFWYIFLVEETITCDSGLDCFPLRASDRFPIQQSPIANCSDFESLDNVTIACYELAFQYVAGLSAFGGLLGFGELALRILITALFYGVDLLSSKNICKRLCGRIVLFLVVVIPLVSSFLLNLGVFVSSIDPKLSTIVESAGYIITFTLMTVYAGSLVVLVHYLQLPPKGNSEDIYLTTKTPTPIEPNK